MTEQTLAVMRARNKAFRWPKGVSGNPGGQAAVYHQCRKLARDASLDMMRGLVDLARNAEDERVRSVCLIAVLDRAGVRPIGQAGTRAGEAAEVRPSRLLRRGPGDHRARFAASVGWRIGAGRAGGDPARPVGPRAAPKSTADPIGVAAEAFTPVCRRPQVANDRCRGVGRLHRHARAVGPRPKVGSVVPTVRPSGKRRLTAVTLGPLRRAIGRQP